MKKQLPRNLYKLTPYANAVIDSRSMQYNEATK